MSADNNKAALVVCGDLNGEPSDGVVEYIRDG
jgi:hypothetical protein